MSGHAADDDTVIVCTEAEWLESARRSLTALGLTYDQLAEQARQGQFSSGDAHALWVSIRDTPGL